jgi:hypothetical protein
MESTSTAPRSRRIRTDRTAMSQEWPLVHQKYVSVGPPRDRLIDAAAEQPIEKAVSGAADDDQVSVMFLRHLEQPLGCIAYLDDVLDFEGLTRQRHACALELAPRKLFRLGLRQLLRQRQRSAGDHRAGNCRPDEFRSGRLERGDANRDICLPRDAHDQQTRRKGLGELRRARKRALRRLGALVADDDRLHVRQQTLISRSCGSP